MSHGNDSVLTGLTERLNEFNNKMTGARTHQLRVNGEHQSIEKKVALEKAVNCVQVRSKTY